ncbi:MAG TPA: CPBP family intramembrane glutamic endopeptidase [bacterium]|nr:CPBP family intramembrane glutamic endopeptidase [bacterium]
MTNDRFGPPGQRGYFYTPPRPGAVRPYPPWRVWEALLVVALFAVSQPLVSLGASALMSYVLPASMSMDEAERQMFKVVLPLVIGVSHALGWLGVYWLLVRRHRMRFLAGLRLQGLRRFRVVRVFVAGMSLQLVSVLLAMFFPPPEGLSNPMLRFVAYGPWAVAALFLMAVIMAPFLEEALFRGVLLPALRRRMGFVPAALLVTALFTALHGVQTGGYLPAMAAIAIVGYLLAWLREASGSLWPSVLFHMGFNFTALLPILLLGHRISESFPGLR